MPFADTIAALSSAPGRSDRALIRVSGPGVPRIAGSLLPRAPATRAAFHTTFRLGGHTLPVLAIRFPAPASYTGEETLEIQLPGNPVLVERALAAITGAPGARLARPGEFSSRAYLNGKLTLEQAEGVAASIAATNAEQLDAARRLAAGETGAVYASLADDAATLLALVEAGIDFTDQEDVVPIAPGALHARLRALADRVDALLVGVRGREHAHALPVVVLVGRPNAGKSTLFNALLGRTRAVASPVAGTTRDVLAEPLDLSADRPGAGSVMLHDLAGLDIQAPATPSDTAARDAALVALKDADLLLWCDPAARFERDAEFARLLPPRAVCIKIRTFADRPGPTPVGADVLGVCALDSHNLAELRRRIADQAVASSAAGLAALLPRHRAALRDADVRLRDALARVDPESHALAAPELVADALRSALDPLGELVGRISPDDILAKVFASFCVGK